MADVPDNDPILDTIDQLQRQSFKDFEFVVVDGLYEKRKTLVEEAARRVHFPITHKPPRQTLWVKGRKCAIAAYRNTALSWASGEVVVSLDDCGVYPDSYLDLFAQAAARGFYAACIYPLNDERAQGPVRFPGYIYGFCSYSREFAYHVNGVDEAYDGAYGLEDMDLSARLFHAGMPAVLVKVPGFYFHTQGNYSSDVIDVDSEHPLYYGASVKCPHAAWETQRVSRNVVRANTPDLWSRSWVSAVVGPCQYLRSDLMCRHYHYRQQCGS